MPAVRWLSCVFNWKWLELFLIRLVDEGREGGSWSPVLTGWGFQNNFFSYLQSLWRQRTAWREDERWLLLVLCVKGLIRTVQVFLQWLLECVPHASHLSWKPYFLPSHGVLSPLLCLWSQSYKEMVCLPCHFSSLRKKSIILVYLKRLKQFWLVWYVSVLPFQNWIVTSIIPCWQEAAVLSQELSGIRVVIPGISLLFSFRSQADPSASIVYCSLWTACKAFKRRL